MRRCSGPALIVLLAVFAASLMTSLVSGCGGDNSPEGALRRFFEAWQDMDWEAYKAEVVPGKRELTDVQDELARQYFEQVEVKFEGLRMETVYDEEDPNRAVVTITGGKITTTANILGEEKTETRDVGDVAPDDLDSYSYDLLMVEDDTWYVDFDLG